MATARIELHDRSTQQLIDILENAYAIGYTQEVNKTPQLSFKLPRDDVKWANVIPFREVWAYNELGILIDVFRVMPFSENRSESGIDATVTCEGYGTVLQDDIVPAELIYTNASVTTILTAILGYQTVSRVTLGTVDASLDTLMSIRFSYDNLMLACWAVRNLVGGYITIEPTAGNPALRTLNLRANPGQNIGQRVSKGVNLREISKVSDPTQAVTKIWPLGRGEGIAQIRPSTNKLLAQPATFTAGGAGRSTLVITQVYARYKGWTAAGAALPTGADAIDTRTRTLVVYFGATNDSANWEQGADERTVRSKTNGYVPPAGSPTLDYVHADYLIADDTVVTYGTIQRPFTEKRHEASASLLSAAQQVLAVAKQPRVSYQVKVADLARVYPTESFERLNLFDQINIYDPDLAITTTARIVAVSYGDLWDPSTFSIIVATVDVEPTEVKLADRMRKYETMPDGATTMWVDSFEDNLDPLHPYSRDIYIPLDATVVLKLQLNMRVKAYRYYVSAASSSGAAASSTAGGNGAASSTAGGNGANTSMTGTHSTAQGSHATHSLGHTGTATGTHSAHDAGGSIGTTVDPAFNTHDHATGVNAYDLTAHGHTLSLTPSTNHGSHSFDMSVILNTHTGSHTDHAFSDHVLAHNHGTHDHFAGSTHNHGTHDHFAGSTHNHSVTTTLTPGIIETTNPTTIQLKVDGGVASATATTLTDFDLTPYLTKDTNGNIVRGWHTLLFTPDVNGRVQCAIVEQVFLQSRGVVAG